MNMTRDEEKQIPAADVEDMLRANGAADAGVPQSEETDVGVKEEPRISFWKKAGRKALVFGIIAVVAILLYIVVNMPAVTSFCRNLITHTAPLLIGVALAYLCDPILRLYEYRIFRRMSKEGIRRGLSLLLTVLTVLAILALVVMMIVPQLIESITELVNNYETYLDKLLAFLNGIVKKVTAHLPVDVDISSMERVKELLTDMYGSVDEFLTQIVQSDFVKGLLNLSNIADIGWKTLTTLFTGVKNVLLGLFVAFYILASKEKRTAQINKFRRAMFTDTQNQKIGSFVHLVDKSFGGFIYGKLIDSLIIGVLTFVLLSILNVSPYNMLIATFIGVTNIIPVFGPFIGAIPSFFIVLISNPSKALIFIILAIVIQQLDGNVIGPKILGDNTGVSSLAVIIAITICGSLWGIVGMLVGVPLFAVIIELVKRMLERRLEAKGQPVDTLSYYPKDALGNAEQELYYEHAGLRYKYEHSRLKTRVNRLSASLFGKTRRKKEGTGETSAPGGGDKQDPSDEDGIK